MRIDSAGRFLLGTNSTRKIGSPTNSTAIFDAPTHTIVSIVANTDSGGNFVWEEQEAALLEITNL